ncbi:DUF2249 domain-containing protein [Denitratisoma oestradiolicum]|uniref:Uncharacterized protein n=1 Tax=Denitratisoma oestradiolicum TaxID=311182 RepID=A0A6S6YAN2_9PROT|nr:DUF2249 domain-containing protein [Denitratisoma oestradiolicum]TWO79900.1 hypothetical protein CBW56_12390 [Denitratisoma oestradiolicum]CAB1369652.1 conserved protein of unknown function [Denitratisoma oestradiolicum]
MVVQTIDGRDMQPPEPLELALEALDSMAGSDKLVLILNCQPKPLYQILQRNGYVWEENWRADGSNEIHIRRA